MTKLVAEIDDKVIEAKIKEKEVAKEQYQDAIAAGKAAVFATKEIKNDREEAITLVLGNLLPGQNATVNI